MNPPNIHPWAQWLQATGLAPLMVAWATEWLAPTHPVVLLGRNVLYLAEPLFGGAAVRLGQQLEDPVALQAWATTLAAGLEGEP